MRGGRFDWSGWYDVVTKVVFDESYKDVKPTTAEDWFVNFALLETIEHLDYLNTEDVTTMSWMFLGFQKLKSLDLSHFNTAKVTDMNSMFEECSSLTSLDLSSFNTEKVQYMNSMFKECSSLTSLDLSSFNTSNVTDMSYMFENTGLKTIDLHLFNTEKVKYMDDMFAGSAVETLNLNSFSTKVLETTGEMFANCTALKTIVCAKDWSTSGISTSTDMFKNCTALKGGNGTTCDGTNHIDKEYARPDEEGTLGYFTLPAKDMYAVLESNGTTMTLYFDNKCETRGGVKDWTKNGGCDYYKDVTEVIFNESVKDALPTSTEDWFRDYKALESIVHLDYLNTEEVTSMNNMFSGCEKLDNIDVSHFITFNVTDMEGMFWKCQALTSLDVSSFNTEKVTDMGFMFNGCLNLRSLDLSNFKTEQLTNTTGMFQGCFTLEEIICDGDWSKGGNVTYSEEMFHNCLKLAGGKGTKYDENHVDVVYARTDGLNDLPGYFTKPSEMYAVLESDGTTMTLYFDAERETRGGMEDWWSLPYSSTSQNLRDKVTKAVLDKSVLNAKPKSTWNWFGDFEKLKYIEHLDYLNTEEVITMSSMFAGCKALASIDLSHFDTKKVDDMNQMFNGCSSLTMLNVNGFNVENVTDMSSMFQSCTALKRIVCDGDWSPTGAGVDMFVGCAKLVGGNGTKYDAEHTDETYAVTDGLDEKKGYFTSVYDVFNVRFLDKEGNWLSTQWVLSGEDAVAPAEEYIPQVEHYHFTGWDKAFNNVKGDLDITAQYAINTYTVKFYDADNHVYSTQTVEYGKAAVAPELPEVEGYHFVGWEDAFDNVTEDLKIYPIYEINKYTVKFFDKDDNQIGETQTVNWNEAAVAPETPVWDGHTFTGWSAEFDHVKSDLDIKPIYDVQAYSVTFLGFNDVELKKENVEYGKSATAPSAPEVTGYTFKNWDKDFSNITGDLTVKAVYEINKFTVSFVDWNGTELKKEEVEYGKAATAPSDPTREGYIFNGWDKAFDIITADLTVTAQYEEATVYFTVTYYDWDLTILGTEKVAEGKDAKGLDPEPTREGYTFTGWSKPITNITADLNVMAQYEQNTQTGFDNVQSDNVQGTKVLRDGHIFILRGEHIYDSTGKLVK